MADSKKRAIRIAAIALVALSAGFVMQNMQKPAAQTKVARTEVMEEPKEIQNLAAGAEVVSDAPVAPNEAKFVTAEATPTIPQAEPAEPLVEMAAVETTVTPAQPVAEAAPELPVTTVPETAPVAVADSCTITLDLMPEANAMIGVTLLSPCHPSERVVLKHAGLAVSGMTTANGALFTGLPAMEVNAKVEVLFADGETMQAALAMPEVAAMQRFAVQWQADDAFQVNAFEGGASYGYAGHVSGANPHRPAAGAPTEGGFLSLLGDSTTETPLLAEVYTYPLKAGPKPEVVVEAAVTETTCGRELLGETLQSIGGEVYLTDLTVAMPECDGVGDYLVLKNLALDLNIASAN